MRLSTKSAATNAATMSRRVRLNCMLPIEEVQLNSSTSMVHMHKKLSLVFSSLLHSLRHTLLDLICCMSLMQTCFYLEEVSRHYQPYLQRSVTRKVTGKISLFSSGISLASHSTIDTIYALYDDGASLRACQ